MKKKLETFACFNAVEQDTHRLARFAFAAPIVIGIALVITVTMLGLCWYWNQDAEEHLRTERISEIAASQVTKFLNIHDSILLYGSRQVSTENDFDTLENFSKQLLHHVRNGSQILFYVKPSAEIVWKSNPISEPMTTTLTQVIKERPNQQSHHQLIENFYVKTAPARATLIKIIHVHRHDQLHGYLGEVINLRELVKFAIPQMMLDLFQISLIAENKSVLDELPPKGKLETDVAHAVEIKDDLNSKLWVNTTNYEVPLEANIKILVAVFALLLVLLAFAVWFLARSLKGERLSKESLRITQISVNSSQDAVYYVNSDGYVIYANASACKLLEYTKEELLRLHIADLDSSLSRATWLKRSWIDFSDGSSYATNSFLKTKSGKIFPVELRGNRTESHGHDIFCIFARDLRERLAFDEKLRLTDLRYTTERKEYERKLMTIQYAIDHIRDQVFWTNEQAQIIYANEAACESLGYSKEELTRLTVHDVDPFHTLDAWPKFWSELKTQKFRTLQTTNMRKDGQIIDVEVTASYVEYENVGYCFAFSRDIKERKIIEREMHKAKEIAEEANRAKSLFLANMSHEIRTPMSAILGFTEMLMRSDLSEEQRHKYLYTVQKNSEHLLKLINDILDLSKVESGKFVAKIDALDPRVEIESTLALFREQAESKGLYLTSDFDHTTPSIIYTDGDRLRQIIVNIVGNAIKFTSTGGVTVHVRGDVLIPNDKCPKLEICVADTGCGINESNSHKLFEPFVQANPYLSRSTGGTGLGLALARKFARELGGNVVLLHSAPNQGCVFQVMLATNLKMANSAVDTQPTKLPSSTILPKDKTQPASLADVKVLLVEDGPDNQILLNHFLCSAGADVEIAENGEVAIQKAKKSNFDVVLMDIQMPILDGYQATRMLREMGLPTPVIALTAHAMSGEKERCLQAGCNDYLTKPISSATLIEKVSEFLN